MDNLPTAEERHRVDNKAIKRLFWHIKWLNLWCVRVLVKCIVHFSSPRFFLLYLTLCTFRTIQCNTVHIYFILLLQSSANISITIRISIVLVFELCCSRLFSALPVLLMPLALYAQLMFCNFSYRHFCIIAKCTILFITIHYKDYIHRLIDSSAFLLEQNK